MSISQRDFACACEQLYDRWQRQSVESRWQSLIILNDVSRSVKAATLLDLC